jgi:hypothetical protein
MSIEMWDTINRENRQFLLSISNDNVSALEIVHVMCQSYTAWRQRCDEIESLSSSSPTGDDSGRMRLYSAEDSDTMVTVWKNTSKEETSNVILSSKKTMQNQSLYAKACTMNHLLSNPELVSSSPFQSLTGLRHQLYVNLFMDQSFRDDSWINPQTVDRRKMSTSSNIPKFLRILVIEDSITQRKIIIKQLNVFKDKLNANESLSNMLPTTWIVHFARSGEEALDMIARSRVSYDIFIVDQNLSANGGLLFGHEVVIICTCIIIYIAGLTSSYLIGY